MTKIVTNKKYGILLMLFVLNQISFCQESNKDKPDLQFIPEDSNSNTQKEPLQQTTSVNNMKLDDQFCLTDSGIYPMMEQIDKEFLVFLVLGNGQIKITLYDGNDLILMSTSLKIFVDQIVMLPVNIASLPGLSNGRIEFSLTVKLPTQKCVYIIPTQTDAIKTNFNSSLSVNSSFVNYIHIQVVNKDTNDNTNNQEDNVDKKIQFMVHKFKDRIFKGDETLSMSINHQTEGYPTMESTDLQSIFEDQYIIKQIKSDEPEFCEGKDCNYRVTVFCQNINEFYFSNFKVSSNNQIYFAGEIMFLEELQPQQQKTFKLILDNNNTQDLIFSLNAYKNNPDYYINPKEKPEQLQDYLYQGTVDGNEQTIITQEEANHLGFDFKEIYVTFVNPSNDSNANFLFSVFHSQDINFIPLQSYQSGRASNEEIINYFIRFDVGMQNIVYDLELSLLSLDGDVDLYVKEVIFNSEDSFFITQQDIQQAQGQQDVKTNNNRIFRYSQKNTDNSQDTQLDSILLKFNCISQDGDLLKVDKNLPVSNTCIFVIGIYGKQQQDKNSSAFRFQIKGGNSLRFFPTRKTEKILLFRNQIENFKVEINDSQKKEFKFLKFKIILLSGIGNIYFSNTQKNPNKEDFDVVKELNDPYQNYFKSTRQNQEIEIVNQDQVYFSIQADSLLEIEIYIDYGNSEDLDSEKLYLNQFIERQIDRDRFYQDEDNTISYYQNFDYEITQQDQINKYLKIYISSQIRTLKICIQFNSKIFDPVKGCDRLIDNYVTVLNQDEFDFNQKSFSLAIVQNYHKEEVVSRLPINFSILITDEVQEISEYIKAGQINTFTLGNGQSIIMKASLSKMNIRSLIVLQSSSSLIQADIYSSKNENISQLTLNHSYFAAKFTKSGSFNSQYCIEDQCDLEIKVSSNDPQEIQFYITLIIDDYPVHFKEGYSLDLPSISPINIIINSDEQQSLSFSVNSELEKLNIISKAYNKEDFNLLKNIEQSKTGEKFDFKQIQTTQAQIIYNKDVFKDYKSPIILFSISPDSGERQIPEPVLLSRESKMTVNIHSGVQNLQSLNIYRKIIQKEDFAYYQIQVYGNIDFTILMNVNQGEADLYINKGTLLPTLDNYWKKKDTYKGDEITIEAKEYDKNYVTTFTIGVYAREFSVIQILYYPYVKGPVELRSQELFELTLEPNQPRYFDFISDQINYSLLTLSYMNDIQIDIIKFDETSGKDFLDIIMNKDNLQQTYIQKQNTLPTIQNLQQQNIKGHNIIKVWSYDYANLGILIFDQNKPIEIHSNKLFFFSQRENESQIFRVIMDAKDEKAKIAIVVDTGKIEFSVSDSQQLYNDFNELNSGEFKEVIYTDKSDVDESLKLFKEIYIKINCKENAQFRLQIINEGNFQQLEAYQTSSFMLSEIQDIYLYYIMNEQQAQQLNTVNIVLYEIQDPSQKPELLFAGDQKMQFDEKSNFVPMPIQDYQENQFGIYNKITIKATPTAGKYVLKFPKVEKAIPVRVELNFNNENKFYMNFAALIVKNQEMFSFNMYLNKKGTLNLNYKACEDYKISNISLGDNKDLQVTQIDDKINIQYISENKDLNNTYDYSMGQFQIKIDEPGLLKIEMSEAQEQTNEKSITKDSMYLQSEFKEADSSLFLRQYFDINDSQQINLTKEDKKNEITLNFEIPRLKQQFFSDQTDVKYVQFSFQTFVVEYKEDFFKRFLLCGPSIFTNTNFQEYNSSVLSTLEDIQKEDIYKTQAKVSIYKNQLENYSKLNKIIIITYIQAFFVRDPQLDFLQNTYTKFAEIPYFITEHSILHANRQFGSSKIYLALLFVSLTILIGSVIYFCQRKRRNILRDLSTSQNTIDSEKIQIHERVQRENPSFENSLEMEQKV